MRARSEKKKVVGDETEVTFTNVKFYLHVGADVNDLGSERAFLGLDVGSLLLSISCLRAQRLCLRVDVHGILEHGADFLFE